MARLMVLWLLAILCQFILVTSFTGIARITQQIESEHAAATQWMGAAAQASYQRAAHEFERLFVQSEVLATSYELFIPSAEQRPDTQDSFSRGTFSWFQGRLDTFWAVVMRALQRLELFLEWLPYALLVLVPATIDGLAQRAVKRDTLGNTSVVRYNAALFTIVSLLFLPVFYLFVPVVVHPAVIPIWAVVGAASAVALAANIQKVI